MHTSSSYIGGRSLPWALLGAALLVDATHASWQVNAQSMETGAVNPLRAPEVLYHLTRLGDLPGGSFSSRGSEVNNAGQVSGYSHVGPGYEAFRWDPGTGMLGLGKLPACPSGASVGKAINDLGHVAGVASGGPDCLANEAFLWTPESGMVGLGDLPGAIFSSHGRGVNNLDEVVGYSWYVVGGENVFEAFLWDPQTGMRGIGDLPGGQYGSVAVDINDSTWITGWSVSNLGNEAFLWTPENGMVALRELTGQFIPDASAINNLGQIVGIDGVGDHQEAYLWDPQQGMTWLGRLCTEVWQWSRAEDVNELGQVVGSCRCGSKLFPELYAFVWDAQQGMRKLDDLLDASAQHPYDEMIKAVAINNRGQIVCVPRLGDEAVLLTPFVLGDLNCDGEVNYDDIGPFVLALVDLQAHAQQYPDCHGDWAGDINQDAAFNAFDIDPFVALLVGP